MHPLSNLDSLRINRDVVLTIGVFDGVHLGHQHLIGGIVSRARHIGALATVLTFHPHPRLVLAPSVQPAYLTTIDERLSLISDLGVDSILTMQFTRETSQVSAEKFVGQLCRTFHLVELRVGPDFALGHKREGTIPVLDRLGKGMGFSVSVAEPWQANGVTVSSTRVRQLVRDGDVASATKLLGRPYRLTGEVVLGAQRGRTLGFPTANLDIDTTLLVPADGVYAAYACAENHTFAAVCNIGRRPSFDNAHRTVEVHLLDYDGDLYRKFVSVEFVHRLRDEVRFPSVAALTKQIRADAERARAMLAFQPALVPCGDDR